MTKKRLVPVNNYVVVKRSEPGNTSGGGIYLPESTKEKSILGTVIAIDNNGAKKFIDDRVSKEDDSDSDRDGPYIITSGCTVLFNKYAGVEVELNSEKLLVINVKDILGIVVDDA